MITDPRDGDCRMACCFVAGLQARGAFVGSQRTKKWVLKENRWKSADFGACTRKSSKNISHFSGVTAPRGGDNKWISEASEGREEDKCLAATFTASAKVDVFSAV